MNLKKYLRKFVDILSDLYSGGKRTCGLLRQLPCALKFGGIELNGENWVLSGNFRFFVWFANAMH